MGTVMARSVLLELFPHTPSLGISLAARWRKQTRSFTLRSYSQRVGSPALLLRESSSHMITILGAGGVIANEVVKLLSTRKHPFRLVARNARPVPGATQMISADLSDKEQTVRALAGSSIVYLLVGLKYDHKLWAEMWPRIMANTIEACKRAGARLIFFDNVYMYGKVSGTMTEETPFNPCSKKGEVRAKIATSLINEWKSGALSAMIARSADFYGPDTRNGVPNLLVFEPFAKKQKASWLVNDSVPHSFTYTPDAAQSLVQLAERATAWNQTWHVPAAPNPLTGQEIGRA